MKKFLVDSKKNWNIISNIFRKYFLSYGGWRAVSTSPFLHMAVLISIINYQEWINGNWYKDVISTLPNIIGISISIYSIMFSLMNDRLKESLLKTNNHNQINNYEMVSTTFFHFILMQVLSLLSAIAYKSELIWHVIRLLQKCSIDLNCIFILFSGITSFFGYTLYLYSLTLIIAAAISIHRLANLKSKN